MTLLGIKDTRRNVNPAPAQGCPTLQESHHVGETRLGHVTSIIRHGSRVAKNRLNSWEGYLDNAQMAEWDSDFTDILALPLAAESDDDTKVLQYDALLRQKCD